MCIFSAWPAKSIKYIYLLEIRLAKSIKQKLGPPFKKLGPPEYLDLNCKKFFTQKIFFVKKFRDPGPNHKKEKPRINFWIFSYLIPILFFGLCGEPEIIFPFLDYMLFLFLVQDLKIEFGFAVREVVFLLDRLDFDRIVFLGSLEVVVFEIVLRVLYIADEDIVMHVVGQFLSGELVRDGNQIVVGADEPVNHELAVAILEIFREVFPFRVLFGTQGGQDFPERITLFLFGFHYLPSWSAWS